MDDISLDSVTYGTTGWNGLVQTNFEKITDYINDLISGAIKTTTSTDPAVDAAVTTAIVDAYGGVIITTTSAGNAQTIESPTETTLIKCFAVINNDTSSDSITVNSVVIEPGEGQKFFWDATSWLTIGAVSAGQISIADAGDIITGTDVESALQENRTAINLNTAKETNATHSGEVTGDTALTITAKAVTYAKIQDISATDKILGRSTAGAGVTEEIACTAAGRALLDDASATIQRATLSAAVSGSNNDITSLTALDGSDIDLNGGAIIGASQITNGPGYWFDGVDDDDVQIKISSAPISSYPFTLLSICTQDTNLDSSGTLIGLADESESDVFYGIGVTSDGYALLNFSNTTVRNITGDRDLRGKKSVICGVFTGDEYKELYVNCVSVGTNVVSTTFGAGTDTTGFGYMPRSTPSAYLLGSIYRNLIFNLALDITDPIDKAVINGGPIPYKYQGASQDNMIIDVNDQDFSSGTIGNWFDGGDGNGTCTYDAGPGTVKVGMVTVGSTPGTYSKARLPTTELKTLINGKIYKCKADVYFPSANNNWTSLKISMQNFDPNMTTISEIVAVTTTEDEWQTIELVFMCNSDLSGNITITGFSTTIGDIFYFDNVSVTQIGCVLDLNGSGVGHNQWLDNSGNELNGDVSGAIAMNIPVNHTENYQQTVAMTDDTAWTDVIPASYMLESITFVESAGNAATLDLGTTSGGSDVFSQEVIAASGITVVVINQVFSMTAAQSLYLNDDGVGTWNSASVTATLNLRRLK